MKVGDTVRYLNATGGGVVTRLDDRMAYVEENGFETPVLIKELVVVLPAGHTPSSGARLMFDQSAYDNGKRSGASTTGKSSDSMVAGAKGVAVLQEKESRPLLASTTGSKPVTSGKFQMSLVFEPSNIKSLDKSKFTAVVVNDSPYSVCFCVSCCADGKGVWHTLSQDVVNAEEILELGDFVHEDLPQLEYISVQAFAFSEESDFALCAPLNFRKHLDITKFHKMHCFKTSANFDTPVIEIPLTASEVPDFSLPEDRNAYAERRYGDSFGNTVKDLKDLRKLKGDNRGNNSGSKGKKKGVNDTPSPHKLLPPVEVDLHIHRLTDTIAGMQPADMLQMQLDTVRRTMEAHRKRIGQKIIFIHGKGEGVLRHEVLKLLGKEYPSAELQDASFREYGFGATLVTIHSDRDNGKHG